MRKKSLMVIWLFLVGMFHCVIAMERQTHYTEDQLKTKVLNDACEIKLTQLTIDYSEKSARAVARVTKGFDDVISKQSNDKFMCVVPAYAWVKVLSQMIDFMVRSQENCKNYMISSVAADIYSYVPVPVGAAVNFNLDTQHSYGYVAKGEYERAEVLAILSWRVKCLQ